MSEIINKISNAIYNGEPELVVELAKEAVSEGHKPNEIIEKGGVAALERLGTAYNEMEAFLPELMLGGEAMKALLAYVVPLMSEGEHANNGTVVAGTAQGDLHDIGLNLLATQLAVGGFKVINLGTDTTVNEFIDVAIKNSADIIAVSSLMTTSAYYQEELIKRLEKDGLRDKFIVIVGGGPITPKWATDIGADGYSRTAVQAVELCRELLKGTSQKPLIIE
jgi:5-methyltetrahydrofolate--homocysteine methyltransferase